MKKLLFILLSVCMLSVASNAQTPELSKETKAAEKEAKAKYKELQTTNIIKALKQVGLSDKEVTAFQEILKESSVKGNVIKKDASLSETDKDAKLKAISEEKNAKLKELIGEAKYKEYNKIRKEQKPAEEAIMTASKQ